MVFPAAPIDFIENEDGSIEFPEGETQPAIAGNTGSHDENLAETLDPGVLKQIAGRLIELYQHDRERRKEWDQRFAKGLEVAGYVDRTQTPEEVANRASNVVYPLISEAVLQFVARSIDELWPASGPVKAIVIGDKTPEKEQQAERVAEYMNYQITEESSGWYDEDERLLTHLPFFGMGWKKVYRDERLGTCTSTFVPAANIFVPYDAISMEKLPRLCHRMQMRPNDIRFQQISGNWRDTPLPEPSDDADESEIEEAIDAAESNPAGSAAMVDDGTHTILEIYADYDIPGFEHPDGFDLPYLFVIEEETEEVLLIQRNWAENDERYRKMINLVPFRFLPGLGFYGQGFLHAMGGLPEATSANLRALLDSANLNNWQGGYKSKDVKILDGGSDQGSYFAMGEFKTADASPEDLSKGFWTPPFHPPSEALFKLLGLLIEAGKSWTSSTEAMTGSAPSTGPVGTMVALIEQGSKIFSGIHKRLHNAKRSEYKKLAQLNGMFVPEEGYPYDVGGADRVIFAQDFGSAVDVLPVSDPNIFSNQQRIAIAQATLELAQQFPALYDAHEANKRMLEALKVPDIDGLLLDPQAQTQRDPVSENMALLNGMPIHVVPDQVHEAHIKVHMDFMQHPGFGGNPDVQEMIAAPMAAHIAQHLAFLYQQRMMQMAGIPFVPQQEPGNEEQPAIDPQMQEEIATRAAMASDAFMQTQGLPPAPPAGPDADRMKAEADIEMKRQAAEAEEVRKGDAHAAEERRKKQSFDAEQQRQAEAFLASQARQAIQEQQQEPPRRG